MPKGATPKGSSLFDEAKQAGGMVKKGFNIFTGRDEVKKVGKMLRGDK